MSVQAGVRASMMAKSRDEGKYVTDRGAGSCKKTVKCQIKKRKHGLETEEQVQIRRL